MTSRPRAGRQVSETSFEVLIPSYPGSPRSLRHDSKSSSTSSLAIDYLHADSPFLIAAETGNDKVLEIMIKEKADIQQMDHLGRNALHLAVCSGNERAIKLLLKAGINTNVKDSVGMTPLSLCLMRSPSNRIAKLLFAHGAILMSRVSPMDTGLFMRMFSKHCFKDKKPLKFLNILVGHSTFKIEFVMMCTPTYEEKKILRLLVSKGALVNNPDAPGGRQALHFAAMSNNCDLIRVLVDMGADLYVTNHRNETPKEFAVTFNCKEAAALLDGLEHDNSPPSSSMDSPSV